MVFPFTEGFGTPVGPIFPVQGAWSTFLGALVGIRVLLYALTSEPGENPLRNKNDILIYFLTLFYFGTTGLIIVLLVHIIRRLGVIRALTDKLPVKEHNPRDMAVIITAAIISWVFSTPQLSFIQGFFPIRQLYMSSWGWILILIAMVYYLKPEEEVEKLGWGQAIQSSFVLYTLIIMVFGFDLLYLLFVYLLLKPFLARFGVFSKLRGAATKGRGAIEERAKARAEAKAAEEKPAEGLTGGIVKTMTGLFKAYEAKEAEERRKTMADLRESMDKRLENVEGDIERFSAKQKADDEADLKRLEDEFKEHSKHVPGALKFLLALLAAVINDTLDFLGIGMIPGVSILIDGLTVLFVLPYALPIYRNFMKEGGIWSILSSIPALEFIGSGPLSFLDLFPSWTLGIFFLRKVLIESKDFKELKSTKEALKKRKSAVVATSFGGVTVTGFAEKFLKAGAAVAVVLIIAFLILPMAGVNAGEIALETQRYVASGRLFLDAQQYFQEMTQRIRNVIIAPKIWWEQQLEIFRQDAFVSQVDESATRKLGLFWEDLRPAEKDFEKGRRATVWAILRGEVLDIGKCFENRTSPECVVHIRCRVKDALEVEPSPRTMSMLDLMGRGDSVSCKFIPTKEGVYQVNFISEFDFETRSYLPIYFADRNLVLAYAAEGKDIMDVAGVTDKDPIATYTPGPIAIGIESFATMPIRVDIPVEEITGSVIGPALPGEIRGSGIGISLQNIWRPRGQLQKINDLIIRIPESLGLEECSPAKFIEDKIENGERYYKIDPKYIEEEIEERETKSFRCMLVAAADPKDILNPGAEVTLHSIKVIANYKFAVTADTSVRVLAGGEPTITYEKVQEQALDDYDVCSPDVTKCDYPSKEYCDIDPCNQNCYWMYGIATYDRCTNCDAGCSYFDTKYYCDLDPCNRGCEWDLDECIEKNVGETMKWPTDIHYITKCGPDYIKIKGVRYVYAVESGYITQSTGDTIVIAHPNGYTSEYKGFIERYRKAGNVAKRSVIGRLDEEITLKITRAGASLDLLDFYEDLGYTLEKADDSGCPE